MLKTLIKPICELETGDVLATDHGYIRVHTVKQQEDGLWMILDIDDNGQVNAQGDEMETIVDPAVFHRPALHQLKNDWYD